MIYQNLRWIGPHCHKLWMYHKLYIEGQSKNRRTHAVNQLVHLRAEVLKIHLFNASLLCRIFQHFGAKGYDHMLRQDVQFSGRTDFIRANSGKIWKNAFFKELHAYDRHILPFTNESFYSKVLSILQTHCTIFGQL